MSNSRKRSKSKRSIKDHTGELSPVMAYRALVSHSSTHFRADVEFHEQPRQVLFGLILLGIISGLSVVNVTNNYDTGLALRVGILGVLIALVFYCMLQTKDGLMVCSLDTYVIELLDPPASNAVARGTWSFALLPSGYYSPDCSPP